LFEDWLRVLLRFENSIEVKSGGNDIIYSTAADDLHDDREVEVNLSKPSVATSEATKHLEKINANIEEITIEWLSIFYYTAFTVQQYLFTRQLLVAALRQQRYMLSF